MQRRSEVAAHNEVWSVLNGYVPLDLEYNDGDKIVMVRNPLMFGGKPGPTGNNIKIFDAHLNSLAGQERKFELEFGRLSSSQFLESIGVKEGKTSAVTAVKLLKNNIKSKLGTGGMVQVFATSYSDERLYSPSEVACTYLRECNVGLIEIFGKVPAYNEHVSKVLEELSMDAPADSIEAEVIKEYQDALSSARQQNSTSQSIAHSEDSSAPTRSFS